MPSHLVPLAALAGRLRRVPGFDCAFLVPKVLHPLVWGLGFPVLPVDRQLEAGLRPEMLARSHFKPDIIVDDLSPTSGFFSRLTSTPRVAIVRKGMFPNDTNDPDSRHSSEVVERFAAMQAMQLTQSGLWEPRSVSDLFCGDLNFVPSIPEIEVLPENITRGDTYRYTGPLLLEDNDILREFGLCVNLLTQELSHLARAERCRSSQEIEDDLSAFLARTRGQRRIYFNTGLAYPVSLYRIRDSVINAMLDTGAAVISNVDPGDSFTRSRQGFMHAPLVPMHRVCSAVDLMVHQCGTGTYTYQVLHERPAIILGSRCYDRDMVGRRLQELGAAVFLSAQDLERDGLRTLQESIFSLLDTQGAMASAQRAALAALRARMLQVAHGFDLAATLSELVDMHKRGVRA